MQHNILWNYDEAFIPLRVSVTNDNNDNILNAIILWKSDTFWDSTVKSS